MLEFDEGRTLQRIMDLRSYYREKVLEGRHFLCPNYRSCVASVSPGLTFYEGQLSHVGTRYDLATNGKRLRLVVTGIAYGHAPAKVDMSDRCKMVVRDTGVDRRYYSDRTRKGRNPHMRGTTLLLRRILLGRAGLKDYANWKTEFVGDTGQNDNHIFNMFALVNFLLCSARAGSSRDRSTGTMLLNCFTHYMETLKILEPTLVVFQGTGRFGRGTDEIGLGSCWQPIDGHLGYFEHGHLKFVTCEFCHPAYRSDPWGDRPARPYFRGTVLPTIDRALRVLGIET